MDGVRRSMWRPCPSHAGCNALWEQVGDRMVFTEHVPLPAIPIDMNEVQSLLRDREAQLYSAEKRLQKYYLFDRALRRVKKIYAAWRDWREEGWTD